MTSLTMYSEWTAPTMLSSMWTKPETKRTKVAHQVSGWVRVVDTTVRVFYPLVATAAVVFAALVWPASAHADSTDSTTDDLLSRIAGVDAGPIRAQLAETGQALCPALVKPASTIATNAAEMQGHGGLTPTIAGIAAGFAMQTECPAFMQSVADGKLPMLLQGLGTDGDGLLPLVLPHR
ncbi:MAG: DUF732 domain-containing protein [Mycobacterium sp.]|nr:DUF732 domain-containing protein [Mycobacterium sp.]